MAKNKRFPSPANVTIRKSGSEQNQIKAGEPVSAVQGVAQELVQIQYNKPNNHFLTGVHSLQKGLNHVPAHVWDSVKQNPFILEDMKNGHIVFIPNDNDPVCSDDEEEESEEESDDSDSKPEEESK